MSNLYGTQNFQVFLHVSVQVLWKFSKARNYGRILKSYGSEFYCNLKKIGSTKVMGNSTDFYIKRSSPWKVFDRWDLNFGP
jgi:hypothetical protein